MPVICLLYPSVPLRPLRSSPPSAGIFLESVNVNILSGIKALFGSQSKVVNDVFDKDNGLLAKAGGFIDELGYTEQENAEDMKQLRAAFTEFYKLSLGESTERSKTRRELAIFWVKSHMNIIFLCVGAYPFSEEIASFYWQVSTGQVLVYGTLGVMAFFFGSHLVSGHLPNKRRK